MHRSSISAAVPSGLWSKEDCGAPCVDSLSPQRTLLILLAGRTYFNVHTTARANGELRAQLNPVGAAANVTGADSFIVRDLTQAGVRVVHLGLGLADAGEVDQVTIHGRNVADNVTVAMNGTDVNVVGLLYDVNASNSGIGEDRFTFLGNDGDDVIWSRTD